ncbi:hypothetical protein QA640_43620 [Bradyrhizobium sp. CB82]|uniref:hypothetical protein n=1 Tax=Bradyrhizobium sp. CB82 TaxID=3039159 RepID=UPI0024B24EB4|nr:hypothetical protein [Bradyrhizobium sp. CB82]WFU40954.1 hypothetical protein QA640_43620 [Bradyrhizobium sp. CB82]
MAYVKPFDGVTGEVNAWLYRKGRTTDLLAFRRIISDHAVEQNAERPTVFDRLIPSTLSLLDGSNWPDRLPFAERTVICWSPADLTVVRLAERGRDIWSAEDHGRFCRIFADIAARYRLFIVDTGTLGPDAALERVSRHFFSGK